MYICTYVNYTVYYTIIIRKCNIFNNNESQLVYMHVQMHCTVHWYIGIHMQYSNADNCLAEYGVGVHTRMYSHYNYSINVDS